MGYLPHLRGWPVLAALVPILFSACTRTGYDKDADDGGQLTDATGDLGEGRSACLTLSGPAAVAGGSCSSTYTISQQEGDGVPVVTDESTVVLLSGGGRGRFYSDAGCTIVIDSLLIGAGSSSATFYFQAPLAEQLTFTVTDGMGRCAPASLAVTVTLTPLVVEPVYPARGRSWNSYVLDDGADLFSARDSPCGAAAEARCLHGGELKRAALAGLRDCQPLEITDALGAFDWTCRPGLAGGLVLYSAGLAAGKGLADLVDPMAWRPNRLEVRLAGQLVAASEEAAWWDNPVVALPDNRTGDRLVLDDVDDDGAGPDGSFAPGTIFTVAADQETNGYNLALDGLALVTLASATLSYAGSAKLNCNEVRADANASDGKICLLAASARRFLWIEGTFDGAKPLQTTAHFLFNLYRVSDSTLRQVGGKNALSHGLLLREAARNRLTEITIQNTRGRSLFLNDADDNLVERVRALQAGDMGISIGGEAGCDRNVLRDVLIEGAVAQSLYFAKGSDNLFHGLASVGCQHDLSSLTIYAHDNRFIDVSSHRNAGHGLLVGGDRNVFVNTTLTNNGRDGLRVSCSWRGPVENTFVGVLAAQNGESGVGLSNSVELSTERNTVSHVTAINNAGSGIYIGGADRNLLHQVVTANNGGDGLTIAYNDPENNTVYDLASVHNAGAAVRLIYASSSRFHGQLIVGGSPADCVVSGGSLPGLIDGSCSLAGTTGSRDYGSQLSDAVLEVGADLSSAFLGKVFSDDPFNSSDVGGAQDASAVLDWRTFASAYRFWGLDGEVFPSPDNRGPCLAGSCRIWDARLSGAPSPLFARHGVFVAGAACPAGASGDSVVDDWQSVPNRFLAHAVEILFDGLGDDDGLCESQEDCLYSPHLGAFQGGGGITAQPCTFTDGQISGVDLRAHVSAAH